MAGPPRHGLPNVFFASDYGSCRDCGKRCLVWMGEVEAFHPLTFWAWSGGALFEFLGSRHSFGAHQTLAHSQVAIAKAHRHGSVQPDFDPHLSSAQAGANIRTSDPIDLVVELNGVAVAHFPVFHIAQRSRQRMSLG